MRRFIAIIFIIFSACSTQQPLNQAIFRSQRKSLHNSPFETAEQMMENYKVQKKFGQQYLSALSEIHSLNPADTIILEEIFDFICFGCPADEINIYLDTLCYRYEITFSDTLIERNHARIYRNPSYILSLIEISPNIIALRKEIRKNNHWNQYPEYFGDESCFDGSLSFYTVIYPLGDIKSLFVRCWTLDERGRDNNNP